MAAIVQPHRLPAPRPALRPARPELRLVHGGSSRTSLVRPVRRAPVWVPIALAVLVVLAAAAGAVAVGRGALASLAPAPPAAGAPSVSGRTIVVRAGDTVWSIARRLQPSGDVRALVDRLVAANGSATLQAGQRLVVPT